MRTLLMACRILLLLAGIFCWVPGGFAASSVPLGDVVAALEKAYAGLQDVQADFSQKTTIAGLNREQKGNGELFLKRPAAATAMFRFNYSKPKQQIVSNGKQLWFYTADSKQVVVSSVSSMFSGGNSIALSYLTGLGHVSRDFEISFAKEPRDKNGNYQLELVPKKSSPVLARLQLTVAEETVEQWQAGSDAITSFPVVSSVVYDAGGNRTRLDYSRTRVNKGVDSSRFTFRIPEGVEVIKP